MPFARLSSANRGCPHMAHGSRSTSSRRPDAGATSAIRIESFEAARELLRSDGVRQAGFKAELVERFSGQVHAPVLFQEGEQHQKQRSATARFFAPRVVATRYRDLMERMSEKLVARFRVAGRAHLDDMSLELAVAVAAEIVGLTNSSGAGMARRLNRFFSTGAAAGGPVAAFGIFLTGQFHMLMFYLFDVRPAICTRRRKPGDDVISHLIGQGYSDREILTECVTYGAAGMATTREFIVMAALRLLEQEDLRTRFLAANEMERIAILDEVLRLEPVVSVLKRRTERDFMLYFDAESVVIPARTVVEIDVRAANRDPAAVGASPHDLDPDRVRAARVSPSVMAFGDGPHRCPGASVALQETAIFLGHLLQVPGLHLEQAPVMSSNVLTSGYELRNAVITVEG